MKSQFLTPGGEVPNLEQAYLGTSPRSQINGTSYVFTAADFSPHRTVPRFRKAAVGILEFSLRIWTEGSKRLATKTSPTPHIHMNKYSKHWM